jgi:asparagine synthase (glutamine-hydrolysing)
MTGVVLLPGGALDRGVLERMTRQMHHRGPDGEGIWISQDGGVGFGHRRLSIIDLSSAGAQPMASASGRYVMTYNGEIYNFADLRAELETGGHSFRGHSDTEVMLAAFERWGVDAAVERFVGMFAFAVWDHREELLHLVRDRLGIKPLFYADVKGALVFGSDLRAVQAFPDVRNNISRVALGQYLRYSYVPAPHTILEGVYKLHPGTIMTFRRGVKPDFRRFWDMTDVAHHGLTNPFSGPAEEVETEFERLLRDSVRRHMVSDVPIGAFLSGGIDSSTVTALMQQESPGRVRTFSIGFREDRYNEAHYAAGVAKHLGTDHSELYVTDQEARDTIPSLPDIYDEPFADVSQIPTYLVSRLARKQVTVVLSGDGGDELFGGYNRYLFVKSFWRRLKAAPKPLRRLIAAALRTASPATWDKAFALAGRVLPDHLLPALPGQKMYKIAALLSSADVGELHLRVISQWPSPEQLVVDFQGPDIPWGCDLGALLDQDDVARQMYWDTRTYLVDDILQKLDRASMYVGLEGRVPLLDHRVVEFAWKVPLSMKFRQDQGKWILKRVLGRHVPKELYERPKMGFNVPIDDWLRGPLRDWAESYLGVTDLKRAGLNPAPIRSAWEQHLGGRVDRGTALWTVLMFQMWRERIEKWT